MNSDYQSLDKDDEKLFQHYAKGIDKAIRETFPSIPASFTLKPVTIRKEIGCGMFYDFKIALPDDQFAKVSFHTDDYSVRRAPGEKNQNNILMFIPYLAHHNMIE